MQPGETSAPERVGRFVVLRTIGAGSMGIVVVAYDPVLDRRIALKVLRATDMAATDAQLLQEAQAMARLAHPSVVTVHEAGAADGRVFLAMELVEGGTLRTWLAAAPRTWREIRDRFVEAGRGLAAAHDAGLVHRDFKPDNVLVGRDGHARVTDFGLVRATPAVSDEAGADTTTVAGTPRYMAPEQHRGQRADPRVDQFAFCVALYEALWGTDPFAAPDAAARRARVLGGEVAPPPSSKVPGRVAAAVLRGLAVDPDQRYPTMHALLGDLTRDPAATRRRWLPLVAVALVGAGLATLLNGAFTREPEVTTTGSTTYPGEPDPHRFQRGIGMAWATEWGSAVPRASWPALDNAQLDQIAQAGATSTNVRFDWSAIQPKRDVFDWSYADHAVAEVEKRGLEPFAYAGGSPGWVGRDPDAQCTEPSRNPPPATGAGMAAFHDFFRALSSRYCNRVKYYAFWDEPNGCGWMSCGCGDQTRQQQDRYRLWLDQWYQAMREGCRDVVLAVGGLDCSWGDDPDHPALGCATFVEQLYDHVTRDTFDAVALHPHGYRKDLGVALRDNKVLNWEAIRRVSAVLARHGHASRMLWVDGWGFPTTDEQLRAKLVTAGLTGLRELGNVFEATYAIVADPPRDVRAPDRTPSHRASRDEPSSGDGLVSLVGPAGTAQLQPRPAWFAFRDLALGRDRRWHGPINPGMEYQGEPPSQQFAHPMPFWGPDGAWQFHSLFPRPGDAVLGRKAGYYSAGEPEQVLQTLTDRFEAGRRYCFSSTAQGGRDNTGRVPYQIGYLTPLEAFAVLNTHVVAVDERWREMLGVCHDATSGPEIGRPIVIGFGGRDAGGASDIWFDNLRVTSVPLQSVR